jgi:hypothetical protein
MGNHAAGRSKVGLPASGTQESISDALMASMHRRQPVPNGALYGFALRDHLQDTDRITENLQANNRKRDVRESD